MITKDIEAEVLSRDDIRAYYRSLAAQDNQNTMSREYGVPQSIISKVIHGQDQTDQLTPEQIRVIRNRYDWCQERTKIARRHGWKVVCQELGITKHDYEKILRAQRAREESYHVPNVQHFLTMRRNHET